jgi:hypothetical protein
MRITIPCVGLGGRVAPHGLGHCHGRGVSDQRRVRRRGTNIWPDTGGGWMNGRGDDTMTMFRYAHMVDFFTTPDPHDELVDGGNYCLADLGQTYAIGATPQWKPSARAK